MSAGINRYFLNVLAVTVTANANDTANEELHILLSVVLVKCFASCGLLTLKCIAQTEGSLRPPALDDIS